MSKRASEKLLTIFSRSHLSPGPKSPCRDPVRFGESGFSCNHNQNIVLLSPSQNFIVHLGSIDALEKQEVEECGGRRKENPTT